MSTATNSCACGCSPCICFRPPGVDLGCLPVSCVPRPCFFDGQVIGADDVNAIVAYFRNQNAVLARLLGGWGILGGLKVDAPFNAAEAGYANHLATGTMAELTPNPQILAGTKVSVSPGAAIDARVVPRRTDNKCQMPGTQVRCSGIPGRCRCEARWGF